MSIDVVLDAIYLGIGWSNILIKRFDVSIFKFSFKTLLHFNSITSRGESQVSSQLRLITQLSLYWLNAVLPLCCYGKALDIRIKKNTRLQNIVQSSKTVQCQLAAKANVKLTMKMARKCVAIQTKILCNSL